MRAATWGQTGSWHICLMTGVIMLLGGSTACSSEPEVSRRAAETSSSLEVRTETLVTDPAGFAAALPGYRVLPVDGLAIAQRNGLGRIVNSALLGAFARALEAPALDTLCRAIADAAPKKGPENAQACLEGYSAIGGQLRLAAA